MSEKCKGCIATCKDKFYVEYKNNKGEIKECPCVKCLVKVTCTGICERFAIFVADRRLVRGAIEGDTAIRITGSNREDRSYSERVLALNTTTKLIKSVPYFLSADELKRAREQQ